MLTIPPQVFHPGFFFSTKVLWQYLQSLDLKGKKLLELGAGSGYISLSAAKAGAVVTATDINTIAVDNLAKNSRSNKLAINILQSDLFDNIPAQQFDIVAINPPYYKGSPTTESSYAWYCGEHGEYFIRLFEGLKNYIEKNSQVIMVLNDECDINFITYTATKAGFSFHKVQEKRRLWEMEYIYLAVLQ